MVFTSVEFLICFLPVVLGMYFCLPRRAKNGWLLLASLFFYAWGEPKFVLVMLGSILFNYLLALAVSATRDRPRRALAFLILAIAGNLSVLFLYKYANFVTSVARSVFQGYAGAIPQTSFVLPLGISFFTFQAMSYVIDVYRGVPAQRNPLKIALYIALFPQLVAGPIVRYSTVRDQIDRRTVTWDSFAGGVYRFLIGFNKKMLLANLFGVTADRVFAIAEPSCGFAWLGAAAYTFQIFFDFSAYSDMAIGLGAMFGFRFQENFNYPYVSKTVTEFWRRWHISLGCWFRDYVYFPLGGSRVGRGRLVLNLAVVWLLTGLWHGANWTFILWGVLYGALIMFEKLGAVPARVDAHPVLRAVYQPFTMLMVILGWVLFRSETLAQAGTFLQAMFLGADGGATSWDHVVFEFNECRVVLVCGILCSTPMFARLSAWCVRRFPRSEAALAASGWLWQMVLLVVSVSFLAMNAHNPFIYFNF